MFFSLLFLYSFLTSIQSTLGLSIFSELDHTPTLEETLPHSEAPGLEEACSQEQRNGSELGDTATTGFLTAFPSHGALQ